jgi:hypothetical protein
MNVCLFSFFMKTKLSLTLVICLTVFSLSQSAIADILILQYGDIVIGKIVQTNGDGVDIQQASGTVHWPGSMVKELKYEKDESTTNRVPSWVKIISQLASKEWAHDIKQIPATVIDNGVLKDVPYISFRCNTGGYEINIYGDLDNPSCVEIGAIGYNVNNSQAKSNCVDFIASILTAQLDKRIVQTLKWSPKDITNYLGITFEVTLPSEPDAYGGWWISVYSEDSLSNARASGAELLSITQPKIRQRATPTYTTPAYQWSDNDISTYSRPNLNKSPSEGAVWVNGYTRSNGKYVQGYYRNRN